MNATHPDRLKVVLPSLAIGLLTAAFIIAKTGRDALFFQGNGIFQLPVAAMIIALSSLPLAILFVKAMKVWGARPARIGLLLFAAAVIALASPFLMPGDMPLTFAMFIFVPAVFGILFASLWLLASDLFETTPKSESARIFGKIGASSIAGGMLGGFIAKGLAPLLAAKWLLLVGACLIVVVALMVAYLHRRYPSNIVASRRDAAGGRGYVATLANPYARTLLFIAMTGALAGLLIDTQFYIVATMANMGERGNTDFFANFYIMLNLGSLLLQVFLAHRIQDRIGLRGGLMILPLALVGSASFAAAAATALSRSVLKVTEGGLRSSIHRSIWEQAFLPISAQERSLVKLTVDGIGARIAEALGALALLVWVRQVAPDGMASGPINTAWMSWVTLITVVVWLGITHRMRVQVKREIPAGEAIEKDCERFPDQCPCTTELGKGVP